jgi:hypothetical protein
MIAGFSRFNRKISDTKISKNLALIVRQLGILNYIHFFPITQDHMEPATIR